jgi:hypothetical protein
MQRTAAPFPSDHSDDGRGINATGKGVRRRFRECESQDRQERVEPPCSGSYV